MAWDPLEQLADQQRQKLREFEELLLEFNRRINLVSREDEATIFHHHIVHCLSLTCRAFPDDALVVDWGTGGGLPAIPLAIAFPRVQFLGVDSVGKKAQAVKAMARRLQLQNVSVWKGRAEDFDGMLDYSVSRATAPLAQLWSWHTRARAVRSHPRTTGAELWRRGLVCLKGGDLSRERAALPRDVCVNEVRLGSFYDDPYYREKCILECFTSAESNSA